MLGGSDVGATVDILPPELQLVIHSGLSLTFLYLHRKSISVSRHSAFSEIRFFNI